MILPTSLALVVLFTGTLGYPDGPPVVGYPGICRTMQPNHTAVAQTVAAPFEIKVNANCYKPGLTLKVAVQVSAGKDTYFEGMFVQARKPATNAMSYGVFATSDKNLSPLDCFKGISGAVAKNVIGQNSKAHYECKNFEWTAPTGLTGNIEFVGTIVHETPKFWMNVKSSVLTYKADCKATLADSAIVCSGCSARKAWLLPVVFLTTLVRSLVNWQA